LSSGSKKIRRRIEVPIVAIHAFVVGLALWRGVVRLQDVRDDHVEPVVVDAEMPALVTDRVVHATFPRVALALERVPGDGAA